MGSFLVVMATVTGDNWTALSLMTYAILVYGIAILMGIGWAKKFVWEPHERWFAATLIKTQRYEEALLVLEDLKGDKLYELRRLLRKATAPHSPNSA